MFLRICPFSYCSLDAICKPFVGLMQVIRRWKGMENAQLLYLYIIFEIL